MVYKLSGKTISENSAFKAGDYNYPANWLRLSSDSEKSAIGITWVDPEPYYDEAFFWGKDNPKDLATLKTVWIDQQKRLASGLLSPTDWMVIRAAEGGTALPSDTKTYRGNIRTKSKEREDQITAASDTAALCTLIRKAEGTSGALNAWPTS